MEPLIGRKKEQQTLAKIFNSRRAEFVALYGRRRVGKTFLIRQFARQRGLYFELMGQKNATLHEQLDNFHEAVQRYFSPDIPLKKPKSWKEAFAILTALSHSRGQDKTIIFFFDELPWLATPRSGLVQALDYYWNTTWSTLANIKLIVCGSAASWMLENLINAKGGLYNRVTETIRLNPFTLGETKEYLFSRNIKLNHKQVLDVYMTLGGIPLYLSYLDKGKSISQNINDLCFGRDAPFIVEFDQLFKSLFDHSEIHTRMIRAIAKKQNGVARSELIRAAGLSSGGTFNKRLNELVSSSFVEIFTPYGKAKKDFYVKIVDEFTLFYLYWIDKVKNTKVMRESSNYWLVRSKESAYQSWCGYAFEAVCFKHIDQIVRALKLDTVATEVGAWRYSPARKSKQQGVQIDLLIDRTDNAITLCEIKYANKMFTIDKQYAQKLIGMMKIFQERTKTNKQIFLAAITTEGIKRNVWSEDLITQEVVLKDLF